MSKKYTAADYERLANQYVAKAKELQTKERAAIGEIFFGIYGTCSAEEAERFLRTAMENNKKYHWFKNTDRSAEQSKTDSYADASYVDADSFGETLL
jgi:hypothetical protein